MPSVWTFVGVEARTALTAYVFQVSTASAGSPAGPCGFAEAADRRTEAAATRVPTKTKSVLT